MLKITVYADGSTKTNPGIGAWAAIVVEEDDWKESERILTKCYKATTNNRMELLGLIEPLREIIDKVDYKSADIHLYSDSQYAIKAATDYLPKWKRNLWRSSNGKIIKNKDLMVEFENLISKSNPTMHWVKGHSGHPYNERCDLLAKDATNIAKDKMYQDRGFIPKP